MKKKIMNLLTISIVALFLSLVVGNSPVFADEPGEGMSFNLDSTISDKQRKKGENDSYFDLLMKPGEKTDLKVTVLSSSKATQKIKVTPSNSYTSQTGLVDYTTDEKLLDKKAKYKMTDLISEEQVIELKPNESKELVFTLTSPKEKFDGVIVGGLVAEVVEDEKAKKKEEATEGVKITNKFQVIKPVVLRENEEVVKTELVLNDVRPELVGYRTAVVANIENTTPTMFGHLEVVAEVRKKNSEEILKKTEKKDMEMAPNSSFDFPISWNDQPLAPGDYTLTLVAKSGEREWPFTKDFKITKEASDKLNEEAVDLPEKEKLPTWIFVLIGTLIAVILVIIGFLIKKNKESKKKATKHRNHKSSNKKKKSNKSSKKTHKNK